MHLRKIPEDAAADIPEENFVFGEGKVQGAKLGKSGGNLLVKGALQPHLEKHHRHGKGNAGNRHGKALALSGELKPRQRNSQRNNPFV